MTNPSTEKRVHELKTWPDFFERLVDGSKTFELREDDRGFHVGDTPVLKEWRPTAKEYTGREVRRVVTYVISGPGFGLLPNYVCMGIR